MLSIAAAIALGLAQSFQPGPPPFAGPKVWELPPAEAALVFSQAPDAMGGPRSAVDEATLAEASPLRFVSVLGQVETQLNGCIALRGAMEQRIETTDRGASVHPGWIGRHRDCLQTVRQDLTMIGDLAEARQVALMQGQETDIATRAADSMAQVTAYRLRLRRALREEISAQSDFIEEYNARQRAEAEISIVPAEE